jgi:hypothetical protein
MAWPTSKAGTTNVDAGSDQPKLARPDIKQNIDNVNAIIDEFDIASPSNGDILQYNSSSGHWDSVAQSSAGTSISVLRLETTGWENISGDNYRRYLSETFDNAGMVSISSNYQFTLGAGTYLIRPDNTIVGDNEVQIQLYNETDASEVGLFINDELATTGQGFHVGVLTFTIAGTKNFSFRQNTASQNNRDTTNYFYIYK